MPFQNPVRLINKSSFRVGLLEKNISSDADAEGIYNKCEVNIRVNYRPIVGKREEEYVQF